ncbi:hypothetical protein DLAC_06032 [Tieghemostelium lacteum]|uniref:Uncharacterized protein n=1 Tax=Tieghemostelium lacteum TaxID=361077 RepID=A0A151ZH92_TIELA|nr:hypothetical protein DLAC_06032 [Tieghemostelium lacteum]|eukprot:KYQ93358.1 hypothetical protein DLAC_06032 [Tieghemostelium lacteum]
MDFLKSLNRKAFSGESEKTDSQASTQPQTQQDAEITQPMSNISAPLAQPSMNSGFFGNQSASSFISQSTSTNIDSKLLNNTNVTGGYNFFGSGSFGSGFSFGNIFSMEPDANLQQQKPTMNDLDSIFKNLDDSMSIDDYFEKPKTSTTTTTTSSTTQKSSEVVNEEEEEEEEEEKVEERDQNMSEDGNEFEYSEIEEEKDEIRCGQEDIEKSEDEVEEEEEVEVEGFEKTVESSKVEPSILPGQEQQEKLTKTAIKKKKSSTTPKKETPKQIHLKKMKLMETETVSNYVYNNIKQLPSSWPSYNRAQSEMYDHTKVLPHHFTNEYLNHLQDQIVYLWDTIKPKNSNGETMTLTPSILNTLIMSSSQMLTDLLDHLFYQYETVVEPSTQQKVLSSHNVYKSLNSIGLPDNVIKSATSRIDIVLLKNKIKKEEVKKQKLTEKQVNETETMGSIVKKAPKDIKVVESLEDLKLMTLKNKMGLLQDLFPESWNVVIYKNEIIYVSPDRQKHYVLTKALAAAYPTWSQDKINNTVVECRKKQTEFNLSKKQLYQKFYKAKSKDQSN